MEAFFSLFYKSETLIVQYSILYPFFVSYLICMLSFTLVLFSRVNLTSRNTHDIVFRTIEIGVALWFPCVLWNCIRPEQLWCLNPKKILERFPPLRENKGPREAGDIGGRRGRTGSSRPSSRRHDSESSSASTSSTISDGT